ncbi:hypothetical protein HK405_003214, partial [Cladochytrium tenue]
MDPVADGTQAAACLAISLGLVAYAARRAYYSPTYFNIVCTTAILIYTAKSAITLVFLVVPWLNPHARYTLIYFVRNIPHGLLYHLYERRLSIFFAQKRAERTFRIIFYAVLAMYAANTVPFTVIPAYYATNRPDGGYVTGGPGAGEVKIVNYVLHIAIGFIILFGTVVSLLRLIRCSSHNLDGLHAEGDHPTTLYVVILTSDCVKFLIVFLIEVYEVVTAADPSATTGILPAGNVGFQQLVETIKFTVMVLNLYLPSGIANIITL